MNREIVFPTPIYAKEFSNFKTLNKKLTKDLNCRVFDSSKLRRYITKKTTYVHNEYIDSLILSRRRLVNCLSFLSALIHEYNKI